MTGEVEQIDFHGDALWAVRRDGHVYVAVKPICEALGLAWQSQQKRLKDDPVLAEGITTIVIPSPRGQQATTCLRLDLVHGWLFKIDARRVGPDQAEKVLTYQRECYAVLFRHFYGQAAEAVAGAGEGVAAAAEPAAEPLDADPERWRLWLEVINAGRRTFGQQAARELWRQSPLPQPSALIGTGETLEGKVRALVLSHCAEDAAGRVPVAEVAAHFRDAYPEHADVDTQHVGRLLRLAGFTTRQARPQGQRQLRCLIGWRWAA